MRQVKAVIAFLFIFFGFSVASQAASIRIDLSTQRMHVSSASGDYSWPVSTARAGYVTPRGTFSPKSLQRMHFSKKYHMSPMPHSIFFSGGFAIHGTNAVGALGRPASHGCVRLHPANARQLYQIVQAEGGSITITGSSPGKTRYASAGRSKSRTHYASLKSRNSHRGASALAYAPSHRHHPRSVKAWQSHPLSGGFGF